MAFNDLARATAAVRGELDAAVADVLDSGHYLLGRQTGAFEEELAASLGATRAVGVGSGADALELALRALGIGSRDEVITQANTCVPTVAAIARAGATPVLCDVEPEAGTVDVGSMAAAIGPRTRALMPVHLYGQCADMDAVLALAAERGLAVVEDCAQAQGAHYRHRPAGTMGTVGCFSFYPTKNVGALGDAGALVTGDTELADRLRELRDYRLRGEDDGPSTRVGSRLDELQAAMLRVKLRHLDQWNARRREIAAIYTEALRGTAASPLAVLPDRTHVFHLYVMEVPERDLFRAELERRGIATMVHYHPPVHARAPYRALGTGPVALPVTERMAESIVSLPLHPHLTDDEVEAIATAAREAVER